MSASPSNHPSHDPLATNNSDGPRQNKANPQVSPLSSRQVRALPVLAASLNIPQAAQATGVSKRTIHRWLKQENFRTELDRIKSEIAETTRQELKVLTEYSYRVITELMEDPDPMVRLRAARFVIQIGVRICEAENLGKEIQDPKEASPGQSDQALIHPTDETA